MERGQQRRAMAAGGDITAAEIGDRGHTGAFGNTRAVAELQRERRTAIAVASVGTMAQRLSVRTERGDVG